MIRRVVNFTASASMLLMTALAHAQNYLGPEPERLEQQINSARVMMGRWETLGSWQLALVIAVGVLGALVAALQKFEGRKWCSLSVICAGVFISLLTLITKEAFDADHKSYKRLAAIAKAEIFQAEVNLDIVKNSNTTVEDKHDAANEIVSRIERLAKLETGIGGPTVTTAMAGLASGTLGIIGTAYAQAVVKAQWIDQPRSETATTFRFVGSATGTTLASAKRQSLQEAQRSAATGLKIPLDAVTQYGRQVDTYTEFDAARKTYRHYSLIEVNKALVRR